ARELRLGALDQLFAKVLADPLLGARPQRPELQHREEASAAAHPLAAVEDRPSAGGEDGERDRGGDRDEDGEEERREGGVEDTDLEIDPAMRRVGGEPRVAADEGVLET